MRVKDRSTRQGQVYVWWTDLRVKDSSTREGQVSDSKRLMSTTG